MTNMIAWTGHRPKDIPSDFNFQRFAAILDGIGGMKGDIAFITGGALGIDSWAAEYAVTRCIPLHLHLPFSASIMSNADGLYRHIAHSTSVTVIGGDTYDIAMYQKRNESMVDAAQLVLAVWTGKHSGGTANCIRYALKKGVPIYNLLPANGKLHLVRSIT